MNKTVTIDLSSDRLIAIAADLVEEHNYIGALKMLNKNADLNLNDEDSYMLYAEIFDDLGLYEKCINGWFKYLDCAEFSEPADAYEGLAVAYMNVGNEHISAYYYNRLLMNTDELDEDDRKEIIGSFLSREKNPLKFVYPPKLADYSDVISEGIALMRAGEYEQAISEFEQVDEDNEAYLSARNYIAMCNIIVDKCGEAEAECNAILKRFPDSVQALTTLAAVKTEQKQAEESRELARRLLKIKVSTSEDIYKIATVCCENKMHAEAYELFCKLGDELSYDTNVLYFKAVSAFNSGKYEESFAAFDKLLAINPDAVTARYYYELARSAADSGEATELSYFYRMPKEERESCFKTLAAFGKLSKAQADKFCKLVDISSCVLWCFDEREGSGDSELQFLGAMCAEKAGLDGLLSDVLLNAFISDGLKVKILTLLGERNETDSFGVVICHLYKRIYFRKLETGRKNRKNFVKAYANLTAHFGVIDSEYGEKFARTAEEIYSKLEENDALRYAADTDALSAVIYFKSGIDEPVVTRDNLCDFFGVKDKQITKILEAL